MVGAEHLSWHCVSVYSGWWGFNADLGSGSWYCLCFVSSLCTSVVNPLNVALKYK